MKILLINSLPYGSTGTITFNLFKIANESGLTAYMACGYSSHPSSSMKGNYIKIGGFLNNIYMGEGMNGDGYKISRYYKYN